MQINQLHLKVLLDLANQLQQEVMDLYQKLQMKDAELLRLQDQLNQLQPSSGGMSNGHTPDVVVQAKE